MWGSGSRDQIFEVSGDFGNLGGYLSCLHGVESFP
jgi:hypothetical protein